MSKALVATSMAAVLQTASAVPSNAGHNIFHIFTPAAEAGSWGVEALSAFQSGFPSVSEHEPVRAAHELAVHAGISDYWVAKVAMIIERPAGGAYDITAIASENVFRLFKPQGGALDAAWFTGLSAGTAADATNAIEFGPVISLSDGPLALVVNPFFEKTFGQNREDGIALSYGWRATYRIQDKLSIGAEGYGAIENLGNAPPSKDQVHRFGPVLYLGHVHGAASGAGATAHAGHDHDDGPEWHGELGVLFGLTDATPDATFKINIGADF